MELPQRDITVIENYGNNGIYGSFWNTAEAFGFLATLRFRYRSGNITSGYGAPGLADPTPKLPSATSHIRQPLCAILKGR